MSVSYFQLDAGQLQVRDSCMARLVNRLLVIATNLTWTTISVKATQYHG